MMPSKMKRAGLVLSIAWVLIGGYFIYLQYSNQDFKKAVRSICSMDADGCADIMARSKDMFATDWTSITLFVALGLAAIWIALLSIAWVQKGGGEGSR